MNTENKANLSSIFIAILVFSVIFGIVGFNLGRQVSTTPFPSATIDPYTAPVSTKIDTDNWRIYQGADFAFKYPDTWAEVTKLDLPSYLPDREGAWSDSAPGIVFQDGAMYDGDLKRKLTFQEHFDAANLEDPVPYSINSLSGYRYTSPDDSGGTSFDFILSESPESTRIITAHFTADTLDEINDAIVGEIFKSLVLY